jgi:hypothetical protein
MHGLTNPKDDNNVTFAKERSISGSMIRQKRTSVEGWVSRRISVTDNSM